MKGLDEAELGRALLGVAERIPALILQYVANFPGCRWERTIDAIASMTAPPLELVEARAWANDAIHWFVRRSDLYVAKGRRLWPMAPTLIWSAQDAEFRATLVGAVNAGAILGLSAATSANVDWASIPSVDGRGTIGTHYWMIVKTSDADQTRRLAADVGFQNIDLESIGFDLPRVVDLLRPGTGLVTQTDIPSAVWEAYTPGKGWSPIVRSMSSTALIRSGIEIEGRWSNRYFTQASDSTLTEIGWEEASLWQFLSDAENGHHNARLDGEEILIEHRLPPTTTLWMTGLGCWPAGFDRKTGLFSYHIPMNIQPHVLLTLYETLKMTATSAS